MVILKWSGDNLVAKPETSSNLDVTEPKTSPNQLVTKPDSSQKQGLTEAITPLITKSELSLDQSQIADWGNYPVALPGKTANFK